MKKYSIILIAITLLAIIVLSFSGCGKDKTTDTTDPVTQGSKPSESTATVDKPTVTRPKETTAATTEKPKEPATPGLTYTSLGNGLCAVSGILDASATKLVIPEKNSKGEFVVSIEKDAFAMNTMIEEVLIYGASEDIASSAFYSCTSLKKVTLESKTRTIASSAFRSCTALTEVTLPASVSSIDVSAFYGCSSLSTITIDSKNATYRAEGNCIIKDTLLVIGCVGSVIPNSVVSIGDFAFSGMNISTVILPESVKSVGEQAFANNPMTQIVFPEGLEELGAAVFYNCSQLTTVSFPASLKTVGVRLFQACPRIESLTVAENNKIFRTEGLCLIEKETNTVVQGVRLSVIPEGVTAIGDYAFYGAMIQNVIIPEGVTAIGARAFYNCGYMKTITIPESVTSLADDALDKCGALTSITYGGTEDGWNTLTATATIPDKAVVTFLKEGEVGA